MVVLNMYASILIAPLTLRAGWLPGRPFETFENTKEVEDHHVNAESGLEGDTASSLLRRAVQGGSTS